ncbi:uncharacterized protein [Temnothorax longispinosus]|uniref:uncharacterized protein isoform X3 n=1 Tax=Temnothorax longispinosus TaxID=300112 RepID=UPI003A99152E
MQDSNKENENDDVFDLSVQTCGLCETICDADYINQHECLQGYPNYYTDPNTYYFYPMCEDGSILRRSAIDDQEVTVQESLENITNKRKNTRKKLSITEKQELLIELEEQLILEVQAREALWNPQLDLSLRSRKATAQLWKEISEALNGKLSDKEAKTKFKSLHDTYRRIVSNESLASGSERLAKMSKWQHYDNLSFLRDSCLQKQTKSNVSCSVDSNDEDSILSSTDVEQNRQKKTRKQSNNKKDNSALERIADAFCKRNTEAPIVLPDPPENDEVDAIVAVVETRLRKLPRNILDDTAQKLFQLTYELIKNIS